MKTAISTACFYLKEETENALSLIREAGVAACSVELKTFYEYRPEFAKKYAQNLGVAEVSSIETHAHNFEPQLFSPSRRVRGDGFYWLEQVMRSAQLFGAKKYILKAPPQFPDENFGGRLQYLSEIYNFCAGYGVGLCIENNPQGLLDSPLKISEIKEVCPRICFSFNVSSASGTANSCQKYLKETAGSLAQVVIPNADASLIKQLKNTGFEGEIVLKTQNFNQITQLKDIIDKVNSLF